MRGKEIIRKCRSR